MSKKTLNKDNLTALGPECLADLLLEVSTGSAEIKRRLRLELSHNLGPTELARDVRKRLVSLRKSTSFVGWRRRKSLIKDLSTQLDMITEKIAPEEPTEAFELLWQFIELAPSVYERVDDSRGDVGDVFRGALARFEDIGPRAILDPTALAARVWDAVCDNGYGEAKFSGQWWRLDRFGLGREGPSRSTISRHSLRLDRRSALGRKPTVMGKGSGPNAALCTFRY